MTGASLLSSIFVMEIDEPQLLLKKLSREQRKHDLQSGIVSIGAIEIFKIFNFHYDP